MKAKGLNIILYLGLINLKFRSDKKMLRKEHEIIQELVEKPWTKLTFKEIKGLTKKKSESYIYDTLKKFTKNEILKEEKVGNGILYSLNLNSTKAQSYAGIIKEYESLNKKHIPYKDIEEILQYIPTKFFILIVTGSYARNKQKGDSDIDLVIICDNSIEPKVIYSELRHYCEINIPKIHLYVFKEIEFKTMLLDKKANYGKETANNNLIIFGAENYYRILAEVIKNGFDG